MDGYMGFSQPIIYVWFECVWKWSLLYLPKWPRLTKIWEKWWLNIKVGDTLLSDKPKFKKISDTKTWSHAIFAVFFGHVVGTCWGCCLKDISYGGFLKLGVSQNHPFSDDFSCTNHPFLDTPTLRNPGCHLVPQPCLSQKHRLPSPAIAPEGLPPQNQRIPMHSK